ncbi:MAG: PQQ-dependent sugar dehydrogenase [Armatimonadetes bacterium]|nr:PQQ-dependent sugar dehydrogenase [Armatimonadota bacterium]
MVSLSGGHTRRLVVTVVCALALGGCARAANAPQVSSSSHGALGKGVPAFTVRPGYRVTLAADNIPGARFLQLDDKGALYVSRPAQGDILALRDTNGDGVFDRRSTYISGKPQAHGMDFRDGWLWFSQSRAIYKTRDTNGDGKADEVTQVLGEDSLPGGTGHWWRSLLVTDQYIYTSVGDPGNATDQTDTEREKIYRFNLDGSGKHLFSSGIRNTEKLRLRPGTQEVWGCDHGSDNYGAELGEKQGSLQPVTDENPPCEFNYYVDGGFYGHPFVVGNHLPRLEYMKRPDILELAAKTISPAWDFGAHWAPNGWCFLNSDYFGEHHQGDAFIACHGSWNSSKRVGYRVQRVLFDKVTGKPYGSLAIVETLGKNGDVLARPVDCVEAGDGTILWSCDDTGRIYRIEKA